MGQRPFLYLSLAAHFIQQPLQLVNELLDTACKETVAVVQPRNDETVPGGGDSCTDDDALKSVFSDNISVAYKTVLFYFCSINSIMKRTLFTIYLPSS